MEHWKLKKASSSGRLQKHQQLHWQSDFQKFIFTNFVTKITAFNLIIKQNIFFSQNKRNNYLHHYVAWSILNTVAFSLWRSWPWSSEMQLKVLFETLLYALKSNRNKYAWKKPQNQLNWKRNRENNILRYQCEIL